ncbi:hypothetical protein AAFM81_002516 [Vibrio fluvialis]
MRTNLTLSDSVGILFHDLLGTSNNEFHNAYLVTAFADPAEVAAVGVGFDPLKMRQLLANVLAEQTGATVELIKAQLKDALAVKTIAAKNNIFLEPLIKSRLSQADSPIPNYQVAHAIMSYGPDAPKFSDALIYAMNENNSDVPENFRKETQQIFGGLMSDLGYVEQDDGTWTKTSN